MQKLFYIFDQKYRVLHKNMAFNPATHTAYRMTCTPNPIFMKEYIAAAASLGNTLKRNHNIRIWYKFPCSNPSTRDQNNCSYTCPKGSVWGYEQNVYRCELTPLGYTNLGIYMETLDCSCECNCQCVCGGEEESDEDLFCTCCPGENCTHPDQSYFFNFLRQPDGTFSAVSEGDAMLEAVLCIPDRYIPGDEAYITALGTFRIKRRAVRTIEAAFLAYKYRPGGEVYREASARNAAHFMH